MSQNEHDMYFAS